jgi:hypothetical protein
VCEASTDEPDLVVPADVLGAVWLGGPSFRTLVAAGRLEERRSGAVDAADALFRSPTTPWCNTWF